MTNSLTELYGQRAALAEKTRGLVATAAKQLDALTRTKATSGNDPRARLALADAERSYEATRGELADLDEEIGDLDEDINRRELAMLATAGPKLKAQLRTVATELAQVLDKASALQLELDDLADQAIATFGETSVAGTLALPKIGHEPILAPARAMREALRADKASSPIAKFRRAMRECGWA